MTKVITPEAIISYPHIFEPQTPPGATEPVYSCSLVFADGVDLTDLKAAALAVGKEKWGDRFKEMVKSGKVRMPFREDGVGACWFPSLRRMNVLQRIILCLVELYSKALQVLLMCPSVCATDVQASH